MDFRLLGPLTVASEGQQLPITPGNQRTVLAALLLSHKHVVGADQLIDAIWLSPPPAARPTLHNYVKRLRASLGEAGRTRIITVANGYSINAEDHEIDIAWFRCLAAAGLAAARRQDWQRAADQLGDALSMWRGSAFADVRSELLTERYRPELDELRSQATEARGDALLRLSRHRDAITDLIPLVAAEPLRERLHELLMLALYRDGQRAAALAAYQRARRALVTTVGIEPGPALRDLHQAILRGDHA